MAEVTAAMVKKLRDMSGGVSMMKCKKALTEANGDLDKAFEILRKEGAASAEKKAGRATGEGLIAYTVTDKAIAIVELNCETDFVAKNEDFKEIANQLACELAEANDLSGEAFVTSENVQSQCGLLVQKLGENIRVSRAVRMPVEAGYSYSHYSHGGKKFALAKIKGKNPLDKQVAMHIVASSPSYLTGDEIPQEVIDKEKEIASHQLKEQGKPEAALEKILEGKIKKFQKENCLVDQAFITDNKKSVSEALEGGEIESFILWNLGEEAGE